MSEDWEAVVLAGWRRGQSLGAVGPGPLEAHLAHACALVAAIPATAASGLDLGSGAGIPGLALAGLRPEMSWVLLDASLRRIRLVEEIIAAAGWSGRVEAVHERAEIAGRDPRWRGRFDVVTARSFGPPAVTGECAAPLVGPGGTILVTEPPSDSPSRWSDEGLAELGLRRGPRRTDPAVQVLIRDGAVPDRFPRKPGVAGRRPLW